MNTNDPKDLPLSEAEPYRTPAEVSEPANRGFLGSPIAWIVAVGLVSVAAGALFLAPVSTRTDTTIEYVEEFGMSRAGPPIEEFMEEIKATEEVDVYEDASAAPVP
jgi:hypothetical protein